MVTYQGGNRRSNLHYITVATGTYSFEVDNTPYALWPSTAVSTDWYVNNAWKETDTTRTSDPEVVWTFNSGKTNIEASISRDGWLESHIWVVTAAYDNLGPYSVGSLDLESYDDSGNNNNDNVTKYDDIDFDWSAPSDRGVSGITSGVKGYYYELDDSTPDLKYTTSTSCALYNISEGNHKLYVRAVDNNNNLGDVKYISFKVDKSISIPTPINEPDGSDRTPTLQWYSVSDLSGIYYYEVDLGDGYLGIDDKTYKVYSGTSFTTPELPFGDYDWSVRAIDVAGNTSSYSTKDYFTVEDTEGPYAPNISISQNSNNGWYNSSSLSFVLSHPGDRGGSDVTGYYYRYNEGSWQYRAEWTGGETITINVSDGSNNIFEAYAVDEYGNEGTHNSISFKVDTSDPGKPVHISPGSTTSDITPTFRWNSVSDFTGIDYYELHIGDGWGGIDDKVYYKGSNTSWTPSTPLPYGNYTWEVRATDNAGNTGSYSDAWALEIKGYADLITKDIEINGETNLSSVTIRQGDEVTIDALFKNEGDVDSKSDVKYKWWWGSSEGAKTHEIINGGDNSISGVIATWNGLDASSQEEEWISEVTFNGTKGVNPDNWKVSLAPDTYWLTCEIDNPNENDEGNNEGNNWHSEQFTVLEALKSDLITIDITISPNPIPENQDTISIESTHKNNSEKNAGKFNVEYYIDGEYKGIKFENWLDARDEDNEILNGIDISDLKRGNHIAAVVLNTAKTVIESDYNNNSISKQFYVENHSPSYNNKDISVSNVTHNSATISWDAWTDHDGDNITYEVQYGPNLEKNGWVTNEAITTQLYEVTFNGLSANQAYDIKIIATDNYGGMNEYHFDAGIWSSFKTDPTINPSITNITVTPIDNDNDGFASVIELNITVDGGTNGLNGKLKVFEDDLSFWGWGDDHLKSIDISVAAGQADTYGITLAVADYKKLQTDGWFSAFGQPELRVALLDETGSTIQSKDKGDYSDLGDLAVELEEGNILLDEIENKYNFIADKAFDDYYTAFGGKPVFGVSFGLDVDLAQIFADATTTTLVTQIARFLDVSVGAKADIFIDLADLFYATPDSVLNDGKDDWITVWVGGDLHADLAVSIPEVPGQYLDPSFAFTLQTLNNIDSYREDPVWSLGFDKATTDFFATATADMGWFKAKADLTSEGLDFSLNAEGLEIANLNTAAQATAIKLQTDKNLKDDDDFDKSKFELISFDASAGIDFSVDIEFGSFEINRNALLGALNNFGLGVASGFLPGFSDLVANATDMNSDYTIQDMFEEIIEGDSSSLLFRDVTTDKFSDFTITAPGTVNNVIFITHGYSMSRGMPGWMSEMSSSIESRMIDELNIAQSDITTLTMSAQWMSNSEYAVFLDDYDAITERNLVINLDWSALASMEGVVKGILTNTGEESTTDVAEIFSSFLNENFSAIFTEDTNISMIGHSRGGSLIGALAEDFISDYRTTVDNAVFLDPHPVSNDYGYNTSGTISVSSEIENVYNYYRNDGGAINNLNNPNGWQVSGGGNTYNVQLNNANFDGDTIGGYDDFIKIGKYEYGSDQHSDVHLLFQGTIDKVDGFEDGKAAVSEAQADSWYSVNAFDTDLNALGLSYDRNELGFNLLIDNITNVNPTTPQFVLTDGFIKNGDQTNDSTPQFDWSDSIDNNGISKYELILNNNTTGHVYPFDSINNYSILAVSTITDGSYTAKVQAYDDSAEKLASGWSDQISFTIDTVDPTIDLQFNQGSKVLSWNIYDDRTGIADSGFELILNNDLLSSFSFSQPSGSFDMSGEDSGNYKLTVWAEDGAGNHTDEELPFTIPDVFLPEFSDVRIANGIDQDGDDFSSQFDIEFDVNSNIAGSYYVKAYWDDTVLYNSGYLLTSPTYNVNGDIEDYHGEQIVCDTHNLAHNRVDLSLELYDEATGLLVQTWTALNDGDLGYLHVELSSEDVTSDGTRSDFDGSNCSDILWQHQTAGIVGVWTDGVAANWQELGSAPRDTWEIVGIGDFDDNAHSDVLWQNKFDGTVGTWESGNSSNWQELGSAPRDTWEIVGTGDFDGNDKDDILWQHKTDGMVGVWESGDSGKWQELGSAPRDSWEIVGTGDFDGNDKDDILWQNKFDGTVGMWESGNNNNWQELGSTPRDTWKIAGIGDFNDNGKDDILWQNKFDGTVGIWESGNSSNWQELGSAPRDSWEIAGTGDFNGNGTDDILWRGKTSTTVGMWESGIAENWQELGSAPSDWKVCIA